MRDESFDLASLTARIENLEVQNQRWKMTSAAGVLLFASVMLTGAARGDRIDLQTIKASTVEAQEFVLKDADGHIRARLSLPPTGRVEQGQGYKVQRLVPLGAVPDQAALQFYNENGDVVWIVPTSPMVVPVK
jgi:hypothetical protein